RPFALEFAFEHLELIEDANAAPLGLKRVNSFMHDLIGRVTHVGNDWWAVDAGIGLFQERPPPKRACVGSVVSARCYIGVDPFFYFERFSREAGAPPLIYEWRIERIELNETPWVEIRPRHFRRDETREAWREVQQTQAWGDDDGSAEYLLHCELL